MRLLPMNLPGNSSVSRIPIIMEVVGNGKVKCELVRHLSPLTVSNILHSIPITGRLHYLGTKLVYFETTMKLIKLSKKCVLFLCVAINLSSTVCLSK